eukprot:PhF_6_TR15043/c1_g1_i1/m.23608
MWLVSSRFRHSSFRRLNSSSPFSEIASSHRISMFTATKRCVSNGTQSTNNNTSESEDIPTIDQLPPPPPEVLARYDAMLDAFKELTPTQSAQAPTPTPSGGSKSTVPSAPAPSAHRCPKCGKRFDTKELLEAHDKERHPPRERSIPAVVEAVTPSPISSTTVGGTHTCVYCDDCARYDTVEQLAQHNNSPAHKDRIQEIFGSENVDLESGNVMGDPDLIDQVLQKYKESIQLCKEIESLKSKTKTLNAEGGGKTIVSSLHTNVPNSFRVTFSPTSVLTTANQSSSPSSSPSDTTSPPMQGYVNSATVVGCVKGSLKIAFHGAEPAVSFDVSVTTIVSDSANARRTETEQFRVECRGMKLAEFVRSSVKEGYVVSCTGRASLRPVFNPNEAMYTYNALLQLNEFEGHISVIMA